MEIQWSEEEWRQILDAMNGSSPVSAGVSKAVSLFLARASGQVKEDRDEFRGLLLELRAHRAVSGWHEAIDRHVPRLNRLAALAQEAEALRAKVAELEEVLQLWGRRWNEEESEKVRMREERDAARAEVERLKAQTGEERSGRLSWRRRPTSREIVDLWARGDASQEAKGSPVEMPLACTACGKTTPHVWMRRGQEEASHWRCASCGLTSRAGRHPCSPTCTHDDAATPGHPERVKERSEAVLRSVTPHQDLEAVSMFVEKEGDMETVQAMRRFRENWNQSTSMSAVADHVRRHTNNTRSASRGIQSSEAVKTAVGQHGEDTTEEARAWRAGHDAGLTEGWDDGAEAMRAACWEAVQEYLDRIGCVNGIPLRKELKAAIEGAAP